MVSFEQQIADYYGWTIELTTNVIFEYERFLVIKSRNYDIFPPDKIEKLWKFHILSTENYQNYCNKKFNKIIHYDNCQNITSDEKLKKIINTILIYKNIFGTILYPQIWSLSCEFTFVDLNKLSETITNTQNSSLQSGTLSNIYICDNQNQQNQQNQYPEYKYNRPANGYLQIFIKYQNQNNPGPYNLQLINYKYQTNETYENIKQTISKNTLKTIDSIKIIPHPEIYIKNLINIVNSEMNPKLYVGLTINICDFIIAEII